MSHTTRLAFLGKGASFLAIFLVQLLVVYLVVTVTGNRRPSIYIYIYIFVLTQYMVHGKSFMCIVLGFFKPVALIMLIALEQLDGNG